MRAPRGGGLSLLLCSSATASGVLSLDSTFWSWMAELLKAFLKFMSCSETANQRRRDFAVIKTSAGINQSIKNQTDGVA